MPSRRFEAVAALDIPKLEVSEQRASFEDQCNYEVHLDY